MKVFKQFLQERIGGIRNVEEDWSDEVTTTLNDIRAKVIKVPDEMVVRRYHNATPIDDFQAALHNGDQRVAWVPTTIKTQKLGTIECEVIFTRTNDPNMLARAFVLNIQKGKQMGAVVVRIPDNVDIQSKDVLLDIFRFTKVHMRHELLHILDLIARHWHPRPINPEDHGFSYYKHSRIERNAQVMGVIDEYLDENPWMFEHDELKIFSWQLYQQLEEDGFDVTKMKSPHRKELDRYIEFRFNRGR